MKRIVECVPNFSEGRDRTVIDAIAEAVKATAGVRLLNVEPDGDYHRSVFTFVGEPEAVVEAALVAAGEALSRIDMRRHTGGHPRMGAMDVVPFVPVAGVSMADCAACARDFGRRLAEREDLPVYLYEEAATNPRRKNLADVRAGQYEGLPEKLKDPDWKPDFGPDEFRPRSGAVIAGARKFLIAYNVNLATDDVSVANEIAFTLRESGRLKRDANGEKILGPDGKALRIPGRLKCVKGLGVPMPEKGIVQVSMNLTDFDVTPPHAAFEACREEAEKLGTRVTGSEVVGLVPEAALLPAGRFYLERDGRPPVEATAAELLERAVEGLGLSDLYPFEPAEKVVEHCIAAGPKNAEPDR